VNFLEGLKQWKGRQIYITRGVGNLIGVRLNCRPEVSLHTLSPA
jgi:predicted MPP superfamily phosphohydrolase